MPSVVARDVEDITIGARFGDSTMEGYDIYLADIGNNLGIKDPLVIYRIPQPSLEELRCIFMLLSAYLSQFKRISPIFYHKIFQSV